MTERNISEIHPKVDPRSQLGNRLNMTQWAFNFAMTSESLARMSWACRKSKFGECSFGKFSPRQIFVAPKMKTIQ